MSDASQPKNHLQGMAGYQPLEKVGVAIIFAVCRWFLQIWKS